MTRPEYIVRADGGKVTIRADVTLYPDHARKLAKDILDKAEKAEGHIDSYSNVTMSRIPPMQARSPGETDAHYIRRLEAYIRLTHYMLDDLNGSIDDLTDALARLRRIAPKRRQDDPDPELAIIRELERYDGPAPYWTAISKLTADGRLTPCEWIYRIRGMIDRRELTETYDKDGKRMISVAEPRS